MKQAEVSTTSRIFSGKAWAFDRRLYTAMGILALLLVLVGFSRTFYLRMWFDVPPLSVLRYLHGALMTTWYTLFLAQVRARFPTSGRHTSAARYFRGTDSSRNRACRLRDSDRLHTSPAHQYRRGS